jgi:two-component system, NtrC family, sensor histidine kinase KinB
MNRFSAAQWPMALIGVAILVISLLNTPLTLLTIVSGLFVAAISFFNISQLRVQLRRQRLELESLTGVSKQLYDQQVERSQQLGTLNKVLLLLTETLSPDSVLDTVISSASAVSEATAIAVYLFEGNHEPKLVRCAGVSDTFSDTPPEPLLVVNRDQMSSDDSKVVVRNVERDSRVAHLREMMRREGKAAWIELPLRVLGRGLGLIIVYFDTPQSFSEESVELLRTFANQAAQAIQNADLYAGTYKRATDARDQMQAILNTMTEGIVLVDRKGMIALANPGMDLINLDNNRLLGHSIDDLLVRPNLNLTEKMGFQSTDDIDSLLQWLRAPNDPLEISVLSYSLIYNGKKRYIRREAIPVRDEDGGVIGMLLVFYNETEQRELEQARENFSRMVVHDLRSPLTAVTSSIMLLTEMVPPESEFSQMVSRTAKSSQRAIRKLLNRVDSLLDIAKMQSGEMKLDIEPTALTKLVNSACAQLYPLASELRVTFKTEVADSPLLDVDVDKIERVLLNLVDNALKFSPVGSEIVIRAHYDGGLFVRVDVVDRGSGIPEVHRQTIFDSFVQIKDQKGLRRGSGLGLTFCKLAVEAHGGQIWIEENALGGSIFSFTLPTVQIKKSIQDESTQVPT